MNLISIAAAAVLVMASFSEAAPAKEQKATKLPGLDKIKHVVYFMQVCATLDRQHEIILGC